MPYITQEQREDIFKEGPKNEGQLAYVIYCLISYWIHQQNEKGFSYKTAATALGVLETVKLEFVRRQLSSYEDDKIIVNGDVFNSEMKTIFDAFLK